MPAIGRLWPSDDDDDGVCAFENDPSPTVERIVESELGQSGFRGPSLLSRNSQQIANSKREILTSRGNPQNNTPLWKFLKAT